MKKLRFLIFLIFNLAYQDGKKETNDPYFNSVVFLLAFEFCMFLSAIGFLNQFVDFDISNSLESLCGSGKGFVIAVFALMAIPNYYFFIKRKGFDRYYSKFKDDPINTKRNRKIGYICLGLYFPIWLILLGLLKP